MNTSKALGWFFLICLLVSGAASLGSQTGDGRRGLEETGTSKHPFRVPQTGSEIKIDGILNEEAWEKALRIPLEYEVSPRENVEPPVRTEVMLTYDRYNFYVGFRCFDPDPSQIRAHLSERDKFGNEDWVAVEIDTFNDSRRAFTLFSTALGVQMDGISDAAGVKDYNWDMIYRTSGRIHDWGYGVEMAVPFSSLRFQHSHDGQVWGINIVRGYPRGVSHQIWARPYDRSNNCRVCQYLKIEGFEGVSPGKNIEINPTLTAIQTGVRDPFPRGDFGNAGTNTDIGLTCRWGIRPNLSLSGTLKPDFSQVEADAAQLDVNQPFALYYPEKRPFFTEGLDFFKAPLDIIHTRTLRNPLWGIKLSGKEGKNAIGVYILRDDITNLIFPGSEYSRSCSLMEPNTSTVIRYSRDVFNHSNIGVCFTNRSGNGYHNRVFGIDGTLRFSPKDEVVFQILGTATRYDEKIAEEFDQPGKELLDKALFASYVHKTRYHELSVTYKELGNDFRADLGFLPQVGIRYVGLGSTHNWIPKKKGWWTRFQLQNILKYSTNSKGDLLEKSIANSFMYMGVLQSTFSLGNSLSIQRYNGREFSLVQFNTMISASPSSGLFLNIVGSYGDAIDYLNTRKSVKSMCSPSVFYNIGAHWSLNVAYIFERMNVNRVRLYSADISQAEIIYHFNTRVFIRSMLQYYDYKYNPENFIQEAPEDFKQFFAQFLFSFELNPRTVFFLGYSDNYFGGPQYGMTKKDHAVFLKISYAWVL